MTPEESSHIAEIQTRLKELGRGCGTCQACCTTLAVDMTPISATPKPERTRCGHLCSAGCKIYDAKPESCTVFMCLWLALELFENRMPKHWRPDQVGAVVDVNEHGVITAHLKHEERWRKQGPLRELLLYLAQARTPFSNNGYIVLDMPSGNHLLFKANGTTQELIPCGLGPTGNKQFRTRMLGEV